MNAARPHHPASPDVLPAPLPVLQPSAPLLGALESGGTAPGRPAWSQGLRWLQRPAALLCLTAGLMALGAWLGHRISAAAGMEQLTAVAGERLELYASSLEAELARHAYLPSLLAVDAEVRQLLAEPAQPSLRSRARLRLAGIKVRAGLGLAFITDAQGEVLASSNNYSGSSSSSSTEQEQPPDAEARAVVRRLGERLRQLPGQFFAAHESNGSTDYFLVQPVHSGGALRGQIVLKLNLEPLEATWVDQGLRSQGERLLVVDEQEVVILSSVPAWKYHLLTEPSEAQRAALLRSGHYAGPLQQALGLRTEDLARQQATLVRAPRLAGESRSGEAWLLAQERAVVPLALRLVTLSDPAEVWRQARFAAWGGAALGAALGLLLLHLAARRRAHAELEAQVGQRTAELRHSNEELKRQIAQRLQAEDELMQAAKLAVLGQMSAGISHEINQPLTALRALSRNSLLLLDKGRQDRVAENLRTIDEMVERMGLITRQLKSFARKAQRASAPVLLSSAVDGALRLLAHRIEAEQVQLLLDLPPQLRVICEPNRLEQVLVNLLANALDAMQEPAASAPRRLRISTAPVEEAEAGSAESAGPVGAAGAPGRVWVRVSDSGCGLDPALLSRLFEPFFTTKPPGQGLGLGLVISAKIVHEFGGSLRARPHADGRPGMVFEFDLEVSSNKEFA